MQSPQTKSFFRSSLFHWIVLFIVVVLVGGFFYWQYRQDDPVLKSYLSDSQRSTDSEFGASEKLPEGVEVVEQEDGSKLVKNERDGYEIRSKLNSVITYKDNILSVKEEEINNVEFEGGTVKPQYDVVVIKNVKLDMKQWVEKWIDQQDYSEEYQTSTLTNNLYGEYMLVEAPSFGGLEKYIIFKKSNNIYFINTFFTEPNSIFEDLVIY